MRRRESLQKLGLVVSLTSMSGCATILGDRGNQKDDGDNSRSGDLESRGIKPKKGENGHLVVVVTVKNTGKETESADLKVTVKTDGTVHEETPTITIPAGKTKEVSVPFDMTYDRYENATNRPISINLK